MSNVKFTICRCDWDDYYDYRIIISNGKGHVRVSFFFDQIIISDLFVVKEYRRKGYATKMLDKVDEIIGDRQATIVPENEWCRDWYIRRGYLIVDDVQLIK